MKQASSQDQPLIESVVKPFESFIHEESSGGALLFAATLLAMIWANSPWASSYVELWHVDVSLVVGSHALTKSLHEWINDGLMAMFFFVIGLEIKREILVGELASVKQASLPLIAATGGALLPAALYSALNMTGPGARGWGIPMATDIAFALGVLALLGRGIPLGLKVFLTALAIGDDLMAVIVIALFYTSTISWLNLAIGAVFLVLLVGANLTGVRHPLVYSVLGIGGLWLAFLLSGVHATIAGVLAAMTIPASTRLSGQEFLARGKSLLQRFEEVTSSDTPPLANRAQQQVTHRMEKAVKNVETPLQRMEQALHPWVTIFVMPVFALANAGVVVNAEVGTALLHPVAIGVMLGLLIGKPIGIVTAAWLAVRSGFATLPEGVSWPHMIGVGFLGGIGFTMSLFIITLAFPNGDVSMSAKVGVLSASAIAGSVGWVLLRRVGAHGKGI